MNKKIFFVTNIPTPYRNSFYNDLYKAGLDFEVLYQRSTENGRYWSVKDMFFEYPYKIFNGFYFKIKRFHLHFVPSMILNLIANRNNRIVIGLGWNEIDMFLLIILKRLGYFRESFYFWSEANFMTVGASNDNIFKKYYRRFIYNTKGSVHILSGEMTYLTLKRWGVIVQGVISLPNAIQEHSFYLNDNELAKRSTNTLPIFVVPIRLVEQDKGLLNFFNAIGFENIRKAIFKIAGDGEDRLKYENFIKVNSLQENVILLGHIGSEEMREIYAEANAFLLPSFSDPSPLSVYEAMAMRLPLLLSYRCGNHYEALNESINGFGFDPLDKDDVVSKFLKFMNSRFLFESMGDESFSIYKKSFSSNKIIESFISEIDLIN